jgi:hypothetical protein
MSTKRKPGSRIDLDSVPAEEVAAARAEDIVVEAALRRTRAEQREPAGPPESVQQNEAFMEKMRVGTERALARRIKSGELILRDQLIQALGGKRRWVSEALRAGRLFSVKDSSGVEYFPAFFADNQYERRTLSKVVQALEGLPNESKYYFFTRKSIRLGMTALEALAQGQTMEVVACAIGFAKT